MSSRVVRITFSDRSEVTAGAPTGLQLAALRSLRPWMLGAEEEVGVVVMGVSDQLHSRAPLRQA